jgi:hypothetical protein
MVSEETGGCAKVIMALDLTQSGSDASQELQILPLT